MKHVIYLKNGATKWLYCILNEEKIKNFVTNNNILMYKEFDDKAEAFNQMNILNQTVKPLSEGLTGNRKILKD